jgi:hypothetical protein
LQASKILGKNVGYAIQAKNKLTPEINLHSGLRLTESSYEDNVIQILTGDVIVCTRPANDIQQEKTDLLLKIKTDKLEKEKHRLKERKMRSKEAAKKSLITIQKQKEDRQIKDKKLLEENKETTGKKFDFSKTAQAYLDSSKAKENDTSNSFFKKSCIQYVEKIQGHEIPMKAPAMGGIGVGLAFGGAANTANTANTGGGSGGFSFGGPSGGTVGGTGASNTGGGFGLGTPNNTMGAGGGFTMGAGAPVWHRTTNGGIKFG